MDRRWLRLVISLAAITLLAAACGSDDNSSTPTTAAGGGGSDATGASAKGQAVSIVAEDYKYTKAPETIKGGLIDLSFQNKGTVAHEVGIIEIGDTDVATFLVDAAPFILEGGPAPAYAKRIAAPGEVAPGDELETSFLLPEGNYALFCTLDGKAAAAGETTTTDGQGNGPTGDPHFNLGMAQPLRVTAGDAEASLPKTDSTITARDYSFDVNVKAGKQTVAFENKGPAEIHHAVFFPFAKGTSEADAAAALDTYLGGDQGGGTPPPELEFASNKALPNAGVFSAGLGQTIDMTFESGRTYAVVCFLPDRAGGPPHVIAHQMKKIFTVQ